MRTARRAAVAHRARPRRRRQPPRSRAHPAPAPRSQPVAGRCSGWCPGSSASTCSARCAGGRSPTPGLSRRWHLRAYAESELLGPADARARRRRRVAHAPAHRAGLGRGDALLSVGATASSARSAWPPSSPSPAPRCRCGWWSSPSASGVLAVVAALVVRRSRPDLCRAAAAPPRAARPRAGALAGYQLTIAALLLGHRRRHGAHLSPLAAPRRLRGQPGRRRRARPQRRQPARRRPRGGPGGARAPVGRGARRGRRSRQRSPGCPPSRSAA